MKSIACRWTGEVFQPANKYNKLLAAQQHVTGEIYLLEPVHGRSISDHAHFMALVQKAWENWPETDFPRFPDADTLRYHAAIETGHYDLHTFPCANDAEVRITLHWCRKMWKNSHTVVLYDQHNNPSVVIKVAKSMSFDAMNQREFHRVKQDILDYLGACLGTDLTKLSSDEIYAP